MSELRARAVFVAFSAMVAMTAITLATGVIAAACGGSSTESPWPVEPETPILGPQGEEGKPRPLDLAPDAGDDAAPNVEP